MASTPILNQQLLQRYGNTGPSYHTYPPIEQFHTGFGQEHFTTMAELSNEELVPRPLSLYLHLPDFEKNRVISASNLINIANAQTDNYLQYLQREITLQAKLFDQDRQVEQIELSGKGLGYLPTEQLARVFNTVKTQFNLTDGEHSNYSIEIHLTDTSNLDLPNLKEMGLNLVTIVLPEINSQSHIDRLNIIEQTEKLIQQARHCDFKSITVDLTFGLPGQTIEDFSTILGLIIDQQPDRINLRRHHKLSKNYAYLCILNLLSQKLTQAGYQHISLTCLSKPSNSAFTSNGNLHDDRSYRIRYKNHDLIGFGVSAIHNIGDSYSQNCFNLKQYYQFLDQDRLPIQHGYKLDLDDCLRRDIIMQLNSNLALDMEWVETDFHIDFYDYFYNEMIELVDMQKHGLLLIDQNIIRVTAMGRFLINHICRVFDKYHPARHQHLILASHQN